MRSDKWVNCSNVKSLYFLVVCPAHYVMYRTLLLLWKVANYFTLVLQIWDCATPFETTRLWNIVFQQSKVSNIFFRHNWRRIHCPIAETKASSVLKSEKWKLLENWLIPVVGYMQFIKRKLKEELTSYWRSCTKTQKYNLSRKEIAKKIGTKKLTKDSM